MSSAHKDRVELLQGTLDLIVLRALATMGPQHAYALAARLEQVAEHPLLLNQGTLYPALVRLEQRGWIKGTWQKTENNRDAKYYAITKRGTRALGGVEQAKELHRDARSFVWLEDARRDLRHAARLLRRSPIFTATAALSLAIGIGADTTIFTVAKALLFHDPVGVADPGRLV